MHDAVRSINRLNGDHRSQRNHFSGQISCPKVTDVFRLQPIRRFCLHIHLIRSAKTVEVVDIKRTQVNLHGVKNVAERNSVGLRFFAVHMRIDLRHVNVEAGKHSDHPRCLIAFLQSRSRLLVEWLQSHASPIFNVEFEAGHRAQPLNRRRRENGNKCFLDGCVLFV